MKLFKILKLSLIFIVCLIVMIPAWYSFLDRKNHTCTIEEFVSGKFNYSTRLTITGNALFPYAFRYVEYSKDTVYNISYYVPFVDSLWTPDKPVKVVLQYESGKMAFDDGFKEAVDSLDKTIDSLSAIRPNRITVSGHNKVLQFPRIDSEAKDYLKNKFSLKTSSGLNAYKISINEHFSWLGFLFMTFFVIAIGIFLYFLLRKHH